MTESLLVLLASYLIGSLSFAVILSRAFGLPDPRGYGSGNPGATNVLRSGRKAVAALTLVGDALKGAVAVLLARWATQHHGLPDALPAMAGVGAIAGHLYPVFFGFKGGKGVATAAGVLLAFQPWLGAATLLTWIIIASFFRYSSLASITAAVFAPLYYLFGDGLAWTTETPVTMAIFLMSLLLLWRHRENIGRLATGTESKIGSSKKK